MAKVNPGELRTLIDVCRADKIKEKGIVKYRYKKISTLKCKVKLDKQKYFMSNDMRKRTKTLVFLTHKRDFIVEDNFIKYKDKYYLITEVHELDDHLYLQVFAELVE